MYTRLLRFYETVPSSSLTRDVNRTGAQIQNQGKYTFFEKPEPGPEPLNLIQGIEPKFEFLKRFFKPEGFFKESHKRAF